MDIEQLVGEIGVTVRTGHVPDGWWGSYSHTRHEIVLRPRLGALQRRSTLAHELGHAFYRHAGTTPFGERQASTWAARALIPDHAFVAACQISDTAQGMAHILGVLPRDVTTYIEALTPDEITRLSDILIP